MWTMSNSRANRYRFGACSGAMLLVACASSQSAGPLVAPNAPRPARSVTAVEPQGQPPAETLRNQPVELKSLALRRVRDDTLLARLGRELLRRAPNAVAIDVITEAPLGNLDRNASPEIFVDGVRLGDTWPLPPNRLVVFLPDAQQLREGTAITVAWLGDEPRTRSRRPLLITQAHLQGVR